MGTEITLQAGQPAGVLRDLFIPTEQPPAFPCTQDFNQISDLGVKRFSLHREMGEKKGGEFQRRAELETFNPLISQDFRPAVLTLPARFPPSFVFDDLKTAQEDAKSGSKLGYSSLIHSYRFPG